MELNRILEGENVREVLLDDYDSEKFLFEMSNVLGKYAKPRLDFSFYFSSKDGNRHGIRVKIKWDPNKFIGGNGDGFLELHGDYAFIPSPDAKFVSKKDIETARAYFKKNKCLFAAVWEEKLDQAELHEYLCGRLTLKDLLDVFQVDLSPYSIHSLTDLERCVRENNLFNMND